MSSATASCITMCWAKEASSRIRPSIRYLAIAVGIISVIGFSVGVVAALYGQQTLEAQGNPAICLDNLSRGFIQ